MSKVDYYDDSAPAPAVDEAVLQAGGATHL